jgi:hypothetical protein
MLAVLFLAEPSHDSTLKTQNQWCAKAVLIQATRAKSLNPWYHGFDERFGPTRPP